jgi:hypothetical protein
LCLQGTGIDRKQQIAPFDLLTGNKTDAQQRAFNLRAHCHCILRFRVTDAFDLNRNVLLSNGSHLDGDDFAGAPRSGARGCRLFAQKPPHNDKQNQKNDDADNLNNPCTRSVGTIGRASSSGTLPRGDAFAGAVRTVICDLFWQSNRHGKVDCSLRTQLNLSASSRA